MTTIPEKSHQLLAAEFKASQAENERLKASNAELIDLLIESQESIGGDWRFRRDAAITKYTPAAPPPPPTK